MKILKRVPLDFSWPVGTLWIGYKNPHEDENTPCPTCKGDGYSPQARQFSEQWYGHESFDPVAYGSMPLVVSSPIILEMAARNVTASPQYYGTYLEALAQEGVRLFELFKNKWCHHLIQADVDALVKADRLFDFTRLPRNDEQREVQRLKMEGGENCWLPYPNGYTPTADEVNEWSLQGFGHDCINKMVCVRARCEREGLPVTCPTCEGEGVIWDTPAAKRLCETWEKVEPPTGEGYILWDNGEGPLSEVHGTFESLCSWCALNVTTFGHNKAPAEEWRRMLDGGMVAHVEGNHVFLN